MIFHLLFEQSGTFKKEFKLLGYTAYDYDILNDFGETDYQIDLFNEIEECYTGGASIFDHIDKEDMIMAFFPCVRFEEQVLLWFRGENYGQKNWDMTQKLEYNLKLHKELNQLYGMITKLVIVCLRKNLKLIIENPYGTQHYLTRYWCIKPKVIDYNRRDRGDYYEKPTQYWFINCEPKNNFFMEAQYIAPKKVVMDEDKVSRSLISPQYANRFIREFILEQEEQDD